MLNKLTPLPPLELIQQYHSLNSATEATNNGNIDSASYHHHHHHHHHHQNHHHQLHSSQQQQQQQHASAVHAQSHHNLHHSASSGSFHKPQAITDEYEATNTSKLNSQTSMNDEWYNNTGHGRHRSNEEAMDTHDASEQLIGSSKMQSQIGSQNTNSIVNDDSNSLMNTSANNESDMDDYYDDGKKKSKAKKVTY
jgi:hypothetical protein